MNKVIAFVKKETVLTVAWILATVSMFIVTPDREYIEYIDFRTLGTLWCLMIVISGFTKVGTFDRIGRRMLSRTKYVWQLIGLLVLLPFVSAMFITNDVALLTFVPFAIHILKMSGKKKLIIPVVAYQTIAANLGSMLTPIGNPQNIYLFGLSKMSVKDFFFLMLPYTSLSLLLIMGGVITIRGKRKRVFDDGESVPFDSTISDENNAASVRRYEAIYSLLFILAVLSVAFPTIIKYYLVVAIILVICVVIDRKLIVSIDYALLFTFVGFFVFTGNLERMSNVRAFLISLVDGHEVVAAVVSSQLISNVPAALLLSNFTDKIEALIVGVNLGGLGTLIASMASLISFKLLAHRYNELKGRYLVYFTVVSVIFLAVLYIFYGTYG